MIYRKYEDNWKEQNIKSGNHRQNYLTDEYSYNYQCMDKLLATV